MVRVLTVLVFGVVALACGKSEGPDAGLSDAGTSDAGPADAGTPDAGFDAGFTAPVCLSDAAPRADAGADAGLDFSCRGRAPAPGGQAELVVTGTVTRAGFTRTVMPGVQCDLLRADGTVLASTISGDGGVYRLTWDAGCQPVDGEVRATHPSPDAGFFLSYSLPDVPWRHDRAGLELVLFDASTSGLAAALSNVTLVDGGAVLALTVVDCAGKPVEGAVVSTTGGGAAVRYVGLSGLPSSMLTATTAAGDVIIFNLPGTTVDVIATLDGGVIAQRVVPVHSNAASGTFLSP